ncbi:MAG TPA: carboxypeptidase-like regulatory domain-containing protein, partial [Chitinophagaceae bacterium]|nr:carboxypeptidase-like regulatory domain-containing protein [Chitinophagaceae bacterium]
MKLNAILISLFFIVPGAAQNNFSVIIRDAASGETIPGATAAISGTSFGTSTDLNGYAELKNIPAGRHVFIFSFIGYESRKDTINIPYTGPQPYEVKLHPLVQEEVIIEGTRSNRSIESIPTRVEVLTEEIDEAATMDPSKIAHLLTHSTGIQV